jgi:hypothetical protein
MAKYVAYKDSGNIINDAIVKCINEGILTGNTVPTTNYRTTAVTNTTPTTFEGVFLGIKTIQNNAQRNGTIVLGISSVGSGNQYFEYPLSTLVNAITSTNVNITDLNTSNLAGRRNFYFKFTTPINVNTNYCLFYTVSSTGTVMNASYYGIVGNTNNNLLLSNTALLSTDEIIVSPHIKTDGTLTGSVINGSASLNLSCYSFTIDKDCSFSMMQSPYTITLRTRACLNLIDGGSFTLSAALPNKGILYMDGDANIYLNGGSFVAKSDYIKPTTQLSVSAAKNATTFQVSNVNDVSNWKVNDNILFLPEKNTEGFQPIYKITQKNNNIITTNPILSGYNLNNKLSEINSDVINLESNLIIRSTKDFTEQVLWNNQNNAHLFKTDYPRYIRSLGKSNIDIDNATIANLGYLKRNTGLYKPDDWLHKNSFGYYVEGIFNEFPHSGGFTAKYVSAWSDGGFWGLRQGDFGIGIAQNRTVGVFYPWYNLKNGCSRAGETGIREFTVPNFLLPDRWCEFTWNFNRIYNGAVDLTITIKDAETNQVYLSYNNPSILHGCRSDGRVNFSRVIGFDRVIGDHHGMLAISNFAETWGMSNDLQISSPIIYSNNYKNSNISIKNSKIFSVGHPASIPLGNIDSNLIQTVSADSISLENNIILNTQVSIDNISASSINIKNNTFLNSKFNISNVYSDALNTNYNNFILRTHKPLTQLDAIQINITNTNIDDGIFTTSKIYSCKDNTAITYIPINKENNTLTLSGLKIYNNTSSTQKSIIISENAKAGYYKDPVNVTMSNCDITGGVDLNVCNGIIDINNTIIKQNNTGHHNLFLTLSNQNTSVTFDKLTCFRTAVDSNPSGLKIVNKNIPFSKPPKITLKNSLIYGGFSYNGESGMTVNAIPNLPQNKDLYSINIHDTQILNSYRYYNNKTDYFSASIWLENIWPTQVINISAITDSIISSNGLAESIRCTHKSANATAGKTTYPFDLTISNCNLKSKINLNYENSFQNLFGLDPNLICNTSTQRILSTNISESNHAIDLYNISNPRINFVIDGLNYSPTNKTTATIAAHTTTIVNPLQPFKIDFINSTLSAGQLSLNNFYGDIKNNVISLSTFDKQFTIGDGPVSIKNNRALVSNLSTGDFIKPDNSCNYSYNINAINSYSKVEIKSVSSFRIDSPNPNTNSIYDESKWVPSKFGVALATQASAYQARTVNSGNITLSSSAVGAAFATFSLKSKVNFLRFIAESPIGIYGKIFLNEKMIYCGNIISYPYFIINMREFEWDKKDTFHFVLYYSTANTSVILRDFSYSDNGAEFVPFGVSDVGFYNNISQDLITKFKTIHPRKNNKGNYINLSVDETIESPAYDIGTSGISTTPLQQNVVKTGANISLGKIDSKYITTGTTLGNILDAANKQYQYFYNGDMTLYNDDKLISADYDGNLVDTGAPSERVVPRVYLNGGMDHPHRTKSSPKYVALNAGDYAKVFVFVSKTSKYSLNPANAPRLVVAKNVALGIKEDTILDQFTEDMMIDSASTDWVLLQGSTPAVTNDGVLEFYVDCCGDNVNGTGYINVDSWSASTDNNIGEYWFSDEGETDWNAV